jgi:2-haloacid dehalogenase
VARARPTVVIFDVVETLMSLEPLTGAFAEAELPAALVGRWFDRMLRDAVALSLAGDYRPFGEVAVGSLQVLAPDLSRDAIDRVLSTFGHLPAQPDAPPALRRLVDTGVSVACLSNGPRANTEAFLGRSGLDVLVDTVLSVEDVGLWKPSAAVYEHAVKQLGRPAHEAALVAVHAFDCHGAQRVGLTTGWAARLERRYAEVFAPPDVTGEDLVEVVDGLIALPAS